MRVSRKCEYGLRAAFELASRADDGPVKIQQIAAAQNIPPRFLEIILNELRHAGVVQSRRGKAGGYMLARPAKEITVGEVIESVQGPIAFGGEKGNGSHYVYGDYAFGQLWENMAKAVSSTCNRTTFAELVEYEKGLRGASVADYII